jgi:uncharacterized protein YpmB
MDTDAFFSMFGKFVKFGMILLIVTLVIVCAAVLVFGNTQNDFDENAVETYAKITGYTEYGYPILFYTIDGKEYTVNSRSKLEGKETGDMVPIRYHMEDPTFILTEEDSLSLGIG